MASIWIRPESKFIYACYVDPKGKRRKRSTGMTDPAEAQRVADGLESVAQRNHAFHQVEKVLLRLHRELDEPCTAAATQCA